MNINLVLSGIGTPPKIRGMRPQRSNLLFLITWLVLSQISGHESTGAIKPPTRQFAVLQAVQKIEKARIKKYKSLIFSKSGLCEKRSMALSQLSFYTPETRVIAG
jgi:hypothetical protein